MKIEDMLQALPSREDIATAIGLRSQVSATGDMVTAFGIFGAGMMLGAGLALLFATKAGHQIRHDIVEKVGELGGRVMKLPQEKRAFIAKLNTFAGGKVPAGTIIAGMNVNTSAPGDQHVGFIGHTDADGTRRLRA